MITQLLSVKFVLNITYAQAEVPEAGAAAAALVFPPATKVPISCDALIGAVQQARRTLGLQNVRTVKLQLNNLCNLLG